jgi:hypothetical protein
VARRRIACPAKVTLTREECDTLLHLPGAEFDVPSECWCEQEPEHHGNHHAFGQYVTLTAPSPAASASRESQPSSQEWWVAFDNTGQREFLVSSACDAEDTDGIKIGGEGDRCTLLTGHDGEHNFERLTGAWPLRAILSETSLDDGVDLDTLAPHQRHNRTLLATHQLTSAAYLAIINMHSAERTYGQRSTRHFLADDTPEPQPQIERVPTFTPGLGLAIHHGYLAIVTDPPYHPHYLNHGPDVTITLTEAGREVLRDIEEHLID